MDLRFSVPVLLGIAGLLLMTLRVIRLCYANPGAVQLGFGLTLAFVLLNPPKFLQEAFLQFWNETDRDFLDVESPRSVDLDIRVLDALLADPSDPDPLLDTIDTNWDGTARTSPLLLDVNELYPAWTRVSPPLVPIGLPYSSRFEPASATVHDAGMSELDDLLYGPMHTAVTALDFEHSGHPRLRRRIYAESRPLVVHSRLPVALQHARRLRRYSTGIPEDWL